VRRVDTVKLQSTRARRARRAELFAIRSESLTVAVRALVLGVVALVTLPRGSRAQSPGSKWTALLPGRRVYTTPDSIERIGDDTYRAKIVEYTGRDTTIYTDEVHCADLTARTIRDHRTGARVTPNEKGKRVRDVYTPDQLFEREVVGGPSDQKYQLLCAVARAKYGVTSRRASVRGTRSAARGIGVSYAEVLGGSAMYAMEEFRPLNGQRRMVGASLDNVATLEVVGDSADVSSISVAATVLSHDFTPGTDKRAAAYMAPIVSNVAPQWTDARQWVRTATANAIDTGAAQSIVRDGKRISITYSRANRTVKLLIKSSNGR
jgi:hypothetical protein